METHSILRRIYFITSIIAGLTFPAFAQEANAPAQKSPTKSEMVPSLIVVNAQGASLRVRR